MRCVFRTNPCRGLQDDYKWYRLAGSRWEIEPNSGNTPHLPDTEVVSRAFSTIRIGSSFLVLLRVKGLLSLCVDAPTLREEVGQHRRPIKDTLYLQAENPADEAVLCGFTERCLSVDDAEGLGNPRSEVGAAVDEIWTTTSTSNFMMKFGGVQSESVGESVGGESWVYPRQDIAARRLFARKVRPAVAGPKPFLVALTDRTPSEALSELHIFSGPFVAFSARITSAQRVGHSDFPIALPKRNRAGLLIAGGLLALLASLATCRKGTSPSSEREPMNSSSNVENPSATNSIHSVTNSMVSPVSLGGE